VNSLFGFLTGLVVVRLRFVEGAVVHIACSIQQVGLDNQLLLYFDRHQQLKTKKN